VSFFDEMVEMFEAAGHSPEMARQAAIGRYRNEQAARDALDGVTAASNPEAAALAAEHLIPGSSLPVIDQAEIRLSSAASTYLGMGHAEAERYAARHRDRAEARNSDQVASARYLIGLAEALAAVPVSPAAVRPTTPAPSPVRQPAATAESLTAAVNRAATRAGRRVAEIVTQHPNTLRGSVR
jgi:hypothetical protein